MTWYFKYTEVCRGGKEGNRILSFNFAEIHQLSIFRT